MIFACLKKNVLIGKREVSIRDTPFRVVSVSGNLLYIRKARCVPHEAGVACSTTKALEWDTAWKNMDEPNDRAISVQY